MEFDQYVVARRTRLVEHAASLGLGTAEADALVDRVLEQQRRRIERADDPDPTTYAAVTEAVHPSPSRRPRPRLVVAGVVAALLVAGVLAYVWTRPAQVQVPTTFARDAPGVAQALAGDGLRTVVVARDSCEPRGLVLGSDPPAGESVAEGSTVTVAVAVEPEGGCAADGGPDDSPDSADREAAWDFLRFVRGAPAPDLAGTVYVVLADRSPAMLPAAAVRDPERWAGIQYVADALADPRTGGEGARLRVTTGVPPAAGVCGARRPEGAGPRSALRLQVAVGSAPCPLTVDLYRSGDDVIDAVVVYPP